MAEGVGSKGRPTGVHYVGSADFAKKGHDSGIVFDTAGKIKRAWNKFIGKTIEVSMKTDEGKSVIVPIIKKKAENYLLMHQAQIGKSDAEIRKHTQSILQGFIKGGGDQFHVSSEMVRSLGFEEDKSKIYQSAQLIQIKPDGEDDKLPTPKSIKLLVYNYVIKTMDEEPNVSDIANIADSIAHSMNSILKLDIYTLKDQLSSTERKNEAIERIRNKLNDLNFKEFPQELRDRIFQSIFKGFNQETLEKCIEGCGLEDVLNKYIDDQFTELTAQFTEVKPKKHWEGLLHNILSSFTEEEVKARFSNIESKATPDTKEIRLLKYVNELVKNSVRSEINSKLAILQGSNERAREGAIQDIRNSIDEKFKCFPESIKNGVAFAIFREFKQEIAGEIFTKELVDKNVLKLCWAVGSSTVGMSSGDQINTISTSEKEEILASIGEQPILDNNMERMVEALKKVKDVSKDIGAVEKSLKLHINNINKSPTSETKQLAVDRMKEWLKAIEFEKFDRDDQKTVMFAVFNGLSRVEVKECFGQYNEIVAPLLKEYSSSLFKELEETLFDKQSMPKLNSLFQKILSDLPEEEVRSYFAQVEISALNPNNEQQIQLLNHVKDFITRSVTSEIKSKLAILQGLNENAKKLAIKDIQKSLGENFKDLPMSIRSGVAFAIFSEFKQEIAGEIFTKELLDKNVLKLCWAVGSENVGMSIEDQLRSMSYDEARQCLVSVKNFPVLDKHMEQVVDSLEQVLKDMKITKDENSLLKLHIKNIKNSPTLETKQLAVDRMKEWLRAIDFDGLEDNIKKEIVTEAFEELNNLVVERCFSEHKDYAMSLIKNLRGELEYNFSNGPSENQSMRNSLLQKLLSKLPGEEVLPYFDQIELNAHNPDNKKDVQLLKEVKEFLVSSARVEIKSKLTILKGNDKLAKQKALNAIKNKLDELHFDSLPVRTQREVSLEIYKEFEHNIPQEIFSDDARCYIRKNNDEKKIREAVKANRKVLGGNNAKAKAKAIDSIQKILTDNKFQNLPLSIKSGIAFAIYREFGKEIADQIFKGKINDNASEEEKVLKLCRIAGPGILEENIQTALDAISDAEALEICGALKDEEILDPQMESMLSILTDRLIKDCSYEGNDKDVLDEVKKLSYGDLKADLDRMKKMDVTIGDLKLTPESTILDMVLSACKVLGMDGQDEEWKKMLAYDIETGPRVVGNIYNNEDIDRRTVLIFLLNLQQNQQGIATIMIDAHLASEGLGASSPPKRKVEIISNGNGKVETVTSYDIPILDSSRTRVIASISSETTLNMNLVNGNNLEKDDFKANVVGKDIRFRANATHKDRMAIINGFRK